LVITGVSDIRNPLWNPYPLRTGCLIAAILISGAVVMAVPGARYLMADLGTGLSEIIAVSGLSVFTLGVVSALLLWGALSFATSDH